MKKIPLYEVRKIKDLRDMLAQSVNLYQDTNAFLIKKDKGGEYVPVTYKQYSEDVNAFGTGLTKLSGLGSRIAIIGEAKYEWYVTYLAVTNGTGIVVPLDKELPKQELESLLNRSYADTIVYSSNKQSVIDEIRLNTPTVKHFICMDAQSKDGNYLNFWDIAAQGKQLLQSGDRTFLDAPIDPEAMTILLFTSGTTDKAKAVMLCQRNISANLEGMCSNLYIGPGDIFLSVLPLHHTYECTCGFLCPIYRGCTIAQCEGLRYIAKNMQESKTSIILVVPLMLEMFHRLIMKKAKADPKSARKFNFGIRLTKALRKIGIDKRKQIFKAVHDNFGGNLRIMISGGAAIDPQIMADMQNMGIHCVQGYGLTECAPILALNRDIDYDNRAAGLPLLGVDVQVIDKDENGIGEFIGKGPNVMLGYYEDEEATKQAIDENGYYHTGDLGYINSEGFLIITGRKKNVIISKNGKNIFPEEIESLLLRSEYIAEALVSGQDDGQSDIRVCAEIFPRKEAIEEKFGANVDKEELQKFFDEIIRKVNEQTVSYKHIRKVVIRDTEFDKTTSKKIKRKYN